MGADADASLGLIVAAHGRHAVVEKPDGQRVHGLLRGRRGDVVVGDRVHHRPSGDEVVIEDVRERSNLMYRQDDVRSKAFAANLDAVLVWVAVDPPFSDALLNRALIAAAHAGIPAAIGLNKVDLPGAGNALARLAPLQQCGATIFPVSLAAAQRGASDEASGLGDVRAFLTGRVTLVLGPSGAGKSTLINQIVPDAAAKVGEISIALGAGRHTTTTSHWYWVDPARADGASAPRTALIDSPGFQTFGLHHVPPEDLPSRMPDVQAAAEDGCRFHNCTHRHEPDCAVLSAVQSGRLDARRHAQYVALRDELEAARSERLATGRGA